MMIHTMLKKKRTKSSKTKKEGLESWQKDIFKKLKKREEKDNLIK
jgi:hypothetical protein